MKDKIYGHTQEFWDRKWKDYQDFVIDQFKKKNKLVTMYPTQEDYIEAYGTAKKERKMYEEAKRKGLKTADEIKVTHDITQRLKWETLYNTKIKVAYGLKESLRDLGIEVNVQELRKMEHEEIITKYEDEIKKYYNQLKNEGKSPTEAGRIISEQWFRSP